MSRSISFLERLVFAAVLLVFVFTLHMLKGGSVNALSGSDWQAGYIIDDSLFYDHNSMTVQQIQAFLNARVPVCDTGGTKPSEYGGGTRAQYGTSRGYPPPYVCLKDYHENITTRQNNLEGRPIPPGAASAAQIIKASADHYRISPKVLLVMLQKESSGPLPTDEWPWHTQYRAAMGYGCPDTGPNNTANCNSQFYGFYNQMSNAARQFRLYADNSQNYRYKPNQTNYIQYNPNAGCGGTNVHINGFATAALYNYTPYQPNAAALANLYGTGNNCSAYGNRNFWRIYNDWFGRTTYACRSDEVPYAEIMRVYNQSTYKHFYTAYKCEVDTLVRQGYRYEGVLHYQTAANSPYAVVVHRLYNPTTYKHLWATTQADINNATQNAGYRYEGVAFFAVKPSVPRHVVVHRLYNPQTYQHLWATTQADINNATQNAGYRYEGVAYYGAPPPQ